MQLLAGKVAVVTGASMGIGESIARLFADEGATVVLTSRDAARAEAARGRIAHPDRTLALACDVRNREEIDRVVSLTLHNFGRMDIWVNNAGHGLDDAVEFMDMQACRAMFDTNLFGAIDGMQAAIPAMRRRGGGAIINISSVAGHIPLAFGAAYSATKFAMNAIGKAARIELMAAGINVLTVCPGYIATNFHANKVVGKVRQRMGAAARSGANAESVARATLRGYLKGKREVVVPGYYWFAIKLYQLFPGLIEGFMARGMRPEAEVAADAEVRRAR
jgi:short-subunit dehydrogenase